MRRPRETCGVAPVDWTVLLGLALAWCCAFLKPAGPARATGTGTGTGDLPRHRDRGGDDGGVVVDGPPPPPRPAGHREPLGGHRPAEEPGVDTLSAVPEPGRFFADYVREGRPLLMKGAARNMAAFRLWTDDYLRTHYGDLEVEVEEGKKENRSKGLWSMSIRQFLDEYQREDMYMVASVPPEMAGQVGLLRCLLCGGFTQRLQDAVMWFSSGGTNSVLHFDAVDNINCIMDGTKEIFLVDKKEKESISLDHPDGSFSGVDVDRVDLHKYPGLAKVPWYNVSMQPGDCIFIPYRWFHQVRSPAGRSLALNIWFVHFLRFNASDCRPGVELPEYQSLSRFQLVSDSEQLRGEIAIFVDGLAEGVLESEDLQLLADGFEISSQASATLFELLDQDEDEKITLNEVNSCNITEVVERVPELWRADANDSHEVHEEL